MDLPSSGGGAIQNLEESGVGLAEGVEQRGLGNVSGKTEEMVLGHLPGGLAGQGRSWVTSSALAQIRPPRQGRCLSPFRA